MDPPFAWGDVLDGDPPGEAERGPPVWCVAGPEMLTPRERVEDRLLVHHLEDGRLDLEDRLCVTARAMAPVIESEQAVIGAKLEGAQAAAVDRAQMAPRGVRAVHYATAAVLGGARKVTKTLAAVPDKLVSGGRRALEAMATPEGRRRIWNGFIDPNDLTREQKAATLFVGLTAIVGLLVLTHLAVTLAFPGVARGWRGIFLLFVYAFFTSLGAPFPIEPALIPAARTIGTFATVTVAVCAKVLAAWMVFFLGDEVNDKLRAASEKRPWVGRALDRSERFAKRFGMFAVATFVAVPGLPDFIALYLFGSLHMKLWKFLLGVGLGGAVLYTSVTLGILALL